MSRNYDNWERLVGAVLRREKDRRLAYCESFSSSSSADLSSRFSLVRDVHESAGLCSANIFFSRDVKAMEYREIRKATSNFREDNTLRGGYRYRYSVYKGWIDENYVAAVKPGSGIAVAVTVEKGGHAGIADWFEQKINLSQYRHPNLVIPIGYYADRRTRIFVNEFMARGSLDRHLFIMQKPLPWATRMRVAVGAARGLAFLHSLRIPVTYGVLTSRDILLDAHPHHPAPLYPTTAPAADTATISSLPDDLLLECLSRVPHSTLPSLPSVCRRWAYLLNSPAFHLLRLRHHILFQNFTKLAATKLHQARVITKLHQARSNKTSPSSQRAASSQIAARISRIFNTISITNSALFAAALRFDGAIEPSWKVSSFVPSKEDDGGGFRNGSAFSLLSHFRLVSIGRKISIIGRTAMLRCDTWTGTLVPKAGLTFSRKKFTDAAVDGRILDEEEEEREERREREIYKIEKKIIFGFIYLFLIKKPKTTSFRHLFNGS